jgi:hypothetical protein
MNHFLIKLSNFIKNMTKLSKEQLEELINTLKIQNQTLTDELENIRDRKLKIQNFINELENIKECLHEQSHQRLIAPEIWNEVMEKVDELSIFEEEQLVLCVRFVDRLYEQNEFVAEIKRQLNPFHPDMDEEG